MKASGEGAGTKAGLRVEESRADETQEAPRNAKKSFDLTYFNYTFASKRAKERSE